MLKRSLPRAGTGRPVAALLVGCLLGLSLLVVPAGGASAAVSSIATAPAKADDGAAVMKETVVDARTVDLSIWAPSVTWVNVRLLLPKNWSAAPSKLWPALYLLPGPDKQDFKAWTAYTDVKALTAPDDVLVVMPGAGPAPSYTDEVTKPGQTPARWETFHTVELPQLLQRGYRANGSNAVAGLSSGGFGALTYTMRHPQLYKATASYSAPTDLYDPAATLARLASRNDTGQSLDPWGPPLLGMADRLAHNPQSNLTKFRGRKLYISSGLGLPGPLDDADPTYKDQAAGRTIEIASGEMNQRFVAGLKLVGATPTVHIYPGGLHYWMYWNRELALSYPMLKAAIGGPTTALVTAAPAPAPKKSLLSGLFGGLFG